MTLMRLGLMRDLRKIQGALTGHVHLGAHEHGLPISR